MPYAYDLPDDYDATKKYPVVVILPGQGQGLITDPATGETNEGVSVASDIPATAWSQKKWTGTDEDVIALAIQNPRTGSSTVQANAMVEVLNNFTSEFASADQDRLYVSTVSYGSTLAWVGARQLPRALRRCTDHRRLRRERSPGDGHRSLRGAALHHSRDARPPAQRVTTGQTSFNRIWNAHVALGKTPAQTNAVLKYTEYADSAFYEPDRHLAAAPTYEDEHILQWLLAQ